MKIYALSRVDGGVEILRVLVDGVTPESQIAKWHPQHQAQLTGEIKEILETDIPQDRKYREAWRVNAGAIVVDAQKRAEIDARQPPRSIEDRLAALERAR